MPHQTDGNEKLEKDRRAFAIEFFVVHNGMPLMQKHRIDS